MTLDVVSNAHAEDVLDRNYVSVGKKTVEDSRSLSAEIEFGIETTLKVVKDEFERLGKIASTQNNMLGVEALLTIAGQALINAKISSSGGYSGDVGAGIDLGVRSHDIIMRIFEDSLKVASDEVVREAFIGLQNGVIEGGKADNLITLIARVQAEAVGTKQSKKSKVEIGGASMLDKLAGDFNTILIQVSDRIPEIKPFAGIGSSK